MLKIEKIEMTTGHICCGAGGDVFGAKAAGATPRWAFDFNHAASETCKQNNPECRVFQADIRRFDFTGTEKVDLVVCGIPCQPFTRIGRGLGDADSRDISENVADFITRQRPTYALFENVREYKRSTGFGLLNKRLEDSGYEVSWQVLNTADYGVPQRRHRLFGIAALDGLVSFPETTHTENRSLFNMLKKDWLRFGGIRDGNGMKPLSRKALVGVLRRYKRHAVKGNGFSVQILDDKEMMMTILGVMYQGSGTSSHSTLIWEKGVLRNVSFREACRAQCFPDEYRFYGKLKMKWQQVANAIPTLLAKVLVARIKDHKMKKELIWK